MERAEWISVMIGVVAAISGIVLGWSARTRTIRKETICETKEDTKTEVTMKTDVEYIKRGVDDIKVDMRVHGQKLDGLAERVTRVEESTKSAHHRLDEIIEKK